LPLLVATTHVKIIITKNSHSATLVVALKQIVVIGNLCLTYEAMLLEINGIDVGSVAQYHNRLVGIWELGTTKRINLNGTCRSNPLVYFALVKEFCLLAVGLVHNIASVAFKAHKLVAPPCAIARLRNHVVIVVSTEVQVFESELL
jgi:hypothetical protein